MSAREPVHPEELLLLDYVIGQLPDETRDQIKRHVAGCRACRRTIDDLILTVDELDRLPTMAIPHDSPAELAAARTRPRSRIRFFVPALAIVLFALLALVTLGGSRGGTAKPPPMQTFSLDVPGGPDRDGAGAAAGRVGAVRVRAPPATTPCWRPRR